MDRERIDFELMLDNLDDAVWMTDSEGRIVYTNRSYQIMCGRSKEWFQSQNVYELEKNGYTDICCTKIVCEKKKRIRMIQHMVGTDIGVSLEVLQTCTPIFDAYGAVKYVLGDVVSTSGLQRVYGKAIRENLNLRSTCEAEDTSDMIAESPAMQRILQLAGYVTDIDSNILILGESGVGKNELASYIHRNSHRGKGRIIEVNCAALPESLLESELFGYERGAFTGALSGGKAGLFENTDNGTMFLNEINSLPLSMQGKLLQTIETKTIRRVGSSREIPVDFRLIAAANTDLWECVRNGTFREDLYYRLNVVAFMIPPLRERREDIVPLCLKFLDHFCKAYGRNKLLSKTVLEKVLGYPWPGNVRELKNFVERLVVMTRKEDRYIEDISEGMLVFRTDPAHELMEDSPERKPAQNIVILNLPDGTEKMQKGFSMGEYLDVCEMSLLREVLMQCKNTYRAAELLGISQATVARLKKKYQIEY